MPPHSLHLKVGAIIMLLRNLNTKRGLCNGTRLIVKELKPNLIIAEVISGTANGRFVFIPRIDLAHITPDLPFVLHRRQFPVKLAFAMTINKSQGQTFDKVGLHLPEPVF
ncbi:ATP-dependent DNA helicase PIF1-like [Folsomia candida]|uniref:ATP-dependent DNA helicase PIF1-like n=1 Tax=Folsomia candida TaxID=158441 RepID=UPI000B8F260A|nr:ATP-dependent DNA helicase PIF1-like [Folsomia candida]